MLYFCPGNTEAVWDPTQRSLCIQLRGDCCMAANDVANTRLLLVVVVQTTQAQLNTRGKSVVYSLLYL